MSIHHLPVDSNATHSPSPHLFLDNSSEKGKMGQIVKIQKIFTKLIPLTFLCQDSANRLIRLWKIDNTLIGSVLESDGTLKIISNNNIRSPFSADKKPKALILRLEKIGKRRWDFVYDQKTRSLTIWPHLKAAGYDIDETKIDHMFNRNAKGHFKAHENTAENRNRIVETANNPQNYRGLEARWGNRIYTSRHSDGQIWAKVNPETGKIVQGGRNLNSEQYLYAFKFEGKGICKGIRLHNRPVLKLLLETFWEQLQQTNLTKTYNNTHPHNQAPDRGGNSDIGGVACSSEYIQGLFDSSEALFEQEHLFCLPFGNEKTPPFSDLELQQILRELAVGIYVHSTIPFFSLHFNQNGDLFPVIHPAYKNTLVGRVIGMLDYIMKGYLNGGIFDVDFIQNWHKNPDWKSYAHSSLSQMHGFENYCLQLENEKDRHYYSLRHLEFFIDLMPELEKEQIESIKDAFKEMSDEPKILRDYSEFSNSFRIIAKQKRIQKQDNLFVLDAEFDVEYTLNPSARYKSALDQFRREKGRDSYSYQNIDKACKAFCSRIHDHMVQFPICKTYFSMLSVINFFSAYFSTLKKYRKVPVLPKISIPKEPGCPPLFPHFPLKEEEMRPFTLYSLYQSLHKKQKKELRSFLKKELKLRESYAKRRSSDVLHIQEILQLGLYQLFAKSFNDQETRNLQTHLKPLCERKAVELTKEMIADFKKTVDDFELGQKIKNKKRFIKTYLNRFLEDPIPYDKAKSIITFVGGCGQRLKPQKIEISKQAEQILQLKKNFTTMVHLKPESWARVKMGSGLKGFVFKLPFEEVPSWANEDYLWMESLLLKSDQEEPSTIELFFELVDMIQSGNKNEFASKVKEKGFLFPQNDSHGLSLLHYAVLQPDTFFTEFLLEKEGFLLQKDNHGYIPLHYAAMGPHLCQIAILLSKQPEEQLLSMTQDGTSALVVAIQHRQIEIAKLLIAAGSGPVKLYGGYNLLHIALHHGLEEIVFELLNKKELISIQEINECTEEGGTPLMLACEIDSSKSVEWLMEKGANGNLTKKDGTTALDIAFRRRCLPIVDFFVNRVFKESWSPTDAFLETIARDSNLEIIRLFQKHPRFYLFRHSLSQETILHLATRHGNVQVVPSILSKASIKYLNAPNHKGETAFDLAVQAGIWDIIQALANRGVERNLAKNQNGLMTINYHPFLKEIFQHKQFDPETISNLILEAAQAGNHEAISTVLIPKGANLDNFKSPTGWQILHYLTKCDAIFLFKKQLGKASDLPVEERIRLASIAAKEGSLRVLRFILELIKRANDPVEHLLYTAIHANQENALKLILEVFKGQDIANLKLNSQGTSPGHLAAKRGSKFMLQLLKGRKADFSVHDQQGRRPLYYAIRANALEAVKFILKKGFCSVTDSDLYITASVGNEEIYKWVLAHLKDQKIFDSAIMIALKNNDIKAVHALIKAAGSCPEKAILWASVNGQTEILEKCLLQFTENLNCIDGRNPLDEACLNGHAECVRLLLKAGYQLIPREEIDNPPTFPVSVSAIFAENSNYFEKVKLFQTALKEMNEEEMKKLIDDLPMNEKIQASYCQNDIDATPTQHYLRTTEKVDLPFLEKRLELGEDPNLQDSEGNSWAHLLVKAHCSPFIEGADLWKKNHLGQTILHLAAGLAPLSLFQDVLEKMSDGINLKDNKGQTPIFYAIQYQRESNLLPLIQRGAGLDILRHDLNSPLYLACQQRDLSIIRTLVDQGAPLNQRNTPHLFTPLHYAIESGDQEMAYYFLCKGANAALTNVHGQTALHFAALYGRTSLIRFLAAKGFSPESTNYEGRQPVHLAALRGHIPSLEALASLGTDLDAPTRLTDKRQSDKNYLSGLTPLYFATLQNETETVKWLLDHGVNLQGCKQENVSVLSVAVHSKPTLEIFRKLGENMSYLHSACIHALKIDNVDAIQTLMGWGASLNSDLGQGYRCLHYASLFGALQCTQFLMQNGADATLKTDFGETPLEISAGRSYFAHFQLLFENCSNALDFNINQANSRGETLLHLAAKAGQLAQIVCLLLNGADLEAREVTGLTPFHLAAREGHKETVLFLIACGANINAQSEEGKIPEQLASNPETLMAFEQGKNELTKTVQGESVLHLAIRLRSDAAILLHIHRLDVVDTQDQEGTAPLHLAVVLSQFKTVRALILRGAFINAQNRRGETPLWMACFATKDIKMARLLYNEGADPRAKTHSGFSILEELENGDYPQKNAFLSLFRKRNKEKKNKAEKEKEKACLF